MDRIKDEIADLSWPFSAPSASSGQPQSPGGAGGEGGNGGDGKPVLMINDALKYLKEVKEVFKDQKDKYHSFIGILMDFESKRIDAAGVVAKVKALLKGHPSLIRGFNSFLPKGSEITLKDAGGAPCKKTIELEEAVAFVNKIKKRFESQGHVYQTFLDILNMYKAGHKENNAVYKEVVALLKNHPDLLNDFVRYFGGRRP